jgi:hypothetical protein
MRDLTSRLRAIVRTPVPARPAAGEAPPRELTYEADLGYGGSPDAEASAAALGGVVAGEGGCRFVTVDRAWDGDAWHGAHRVSSFSLDPGAPLGMLDPRLADLPDLTARPVFFDIETTGLSGGAGTLPFVAGCGWFEGSEFRVRQFFLTGPAGEPAMLDALGDVFGRASMLVTYNGRTFDIPTMETRWAFHRRPSASDDLPHFDMLPPARRLWGRRALAAAPRGSGSDPAGGCSLTSLERSQLGFHRIGDVPGFEIPVRYFQFLRTGDATVLEDVLEHNRLDLISLAAVAARALDLAADGPEACREPGEQAGLGRLYERSGDRERAMRAYELAAAGDDRDVRAHALARLAVLLRRQDRHEEAAGAWQGVLDAGAVGHTGAPGVRELSPLERRAAQALAVHHEHRARDLHAARRYAERLETSSRGADDVRRRLNRIDRKLRGPENTTGGPEAAQLFDDEL